MTNDEMGKLMRDVTFVVHDLMRVAYGQIDEYLKKHGLVRSHAFILHALMKGRELPMSELASKLHVTKQNITVLTDKLEKLGFVERVNSEKDRRVILIRLSAKGNDFVNGNIDELMNSFSGIFDQFNSEDLELFKNAIATMKALLIKCGRGTCHE